MSTEPNIKIGAYVGFPGMLRFIACILMCTAIFSPLYSFTQFLTGIIGTVCLLVESMLSWKIQASLALEVAIARSQIETVATIADQLTTQPLNATVQFLPDPNAGVSQPPQPYPANRQNNDYSSKI